MHVQRVLRPVAVGLLAVLLSGCWLQPGFGPTRQNFNANESTLTTANVATLAPVWYSDTAFPSEPLVTNVGVYTAEVGDDGSGPVLRVEATDINTGDRLWRRQTQIADLSSIGAPGPGGGLVSATVNGDVIVAEVSRQFDPRFVELDGETGAVVGTTELLGPDLRYVVDANNEDQLVYRSGIRQTVTVHTLGQQATDDWVGQDADSITTPRDTGPVLATSDRVLAVEHVNGQPVLTSYAVAGCGAAHCSPTHSVALPAAGAGATSADDKLVTVLDDGTAVVERIVHNTDGTIEDDLLEFDSNLGFSAFHVFTKVVGVAASGGTVYVTGADSATPAGTDELVALSGSTVQWRGRVADDTLAGHPIVAGGLVYAADGPDYGPDIQVFDATGCGAATCGPLTTVDTGDATAVSGYSVSDGTLYVTTTDGSSGPRLTAYKPAA